MLCHSHTCYIYSTLVIPCTVQALQATLVPVCQSNIYTVYKLGPWLRGHPLVGKQIQTVSSFLTTAVKMSEQSSEAAQLYFALLECV